MKNVQSFKQCLAEFNSNHALLFLSLLLAGDVFYFIIHTVNVMMPPRNPMLHLGEDQGIPEFYNYIKFLWVIVMFFILAKREKTKLYLVWAFVFAYFLSDDSLMLHENAGVFFASQNFNFTPPFGLNTRQFGEYGYLGSVLLILFATVFLAYRNGDEKFKKTSLDIILLVGLLLFFGNVVDFANEIIDTSQAIQYFKNMAEEGGEHISDSLIAGYCFWLSVKPSESKFYIVDCLKDKFKKNKS